MRRVALWILLAALAAAAAIAVNLTLLGSATANDDPVGKLRPLATLRPATTQPRAATTQTATGGDDHGGRDHGDGHELPDD